MKTATIVTQNNGRTCSVHTSDAGVLFAGPTDRVRALAISFGYYIKAEMTKEVYDLNIQHAEQEIANLRSLGILR